MQEAHGQALASVPPAPGKLISEMQFEAHCAASAYVSEAEMSFPSDTYTPFHPDEGRICYARGLLQGIFPCAFYYAEADRGDKLHIK